jgi:hypothetical protein
MTRKKGFEEKEHAPRNNRTSNEYIPVNDQFNTRDQTPNSRPLDLSTLTSYKPNAPETHNPNGHLNTHGIFQQLEQWAAESIMGIPSQQHANIPSPQDITKPYSQTPEVPSQPNIYLEQQKTLMENLTRSSNLKANNTQYLPTETVNMVYNFDREQLTQHLKSPFPDTDSAYGKRQYPEDSSLARPSASNIKIIQNAHEIKKRKKKHQTESNQESPSPNQVQEFILSTPSDTWTSPSLLALRRGIPDSTPYKKNKQTIEDMTPKEESITEVHQTIQAKPRTPWTKDELSDLIDDLQHRRITDTKAKPSDHDLKRLQTNRIDPKTEWKLMTTLFREKKILSRSSLYEYFRFYTRDIKKVQENKAKNKGMNVKEYNKWSLENKAKNKGMTVKQYKQWALENTAKNKGMTVEQYQQPENIDIREQDDVSWLLEQIAEADGFNNPDTASEILPHEDYHLSSQDEYFQYVLNLDNQADLAKKS